LSVKQIGINKGEIMERGKKKKEKFKTISLQEVKGMLGYSGKGFRSVIRWCLKKKITVFGDGQRRRILESDWISTQQRDLVRSIKLNFPTTWMNELKKRGIHLINNTSANNIYEAKSIQAINLLKNWDDE
jgi:hypothetical protein